jgi:hypothetical protein
MISRLAPILSTLALAVAAPALAYEQLPVSLARLTPSDFAGRVSIADDPLAQAIVISTRKGYTRDRGLRGVHADDVHLRAVVDRRTGAVAWQVWHRLVYVGGKRDIVSVHYTASGAARRSAVTEAEHELTECPPTVGIGSCNRVVGFAFELPEQTVREIAQAYRPGERTPWRLRFEDADGRQVSGGLAPAEAAGLLDAVEAWRRGRG